MNQQLSLSFYNESELRKLPDSEIIAKINGGFPTLDTEIMPQAMAAIGTAIKYTAQLGQLLDELYTRHKASWNESFPKMGFPFSQHHADLFRQQWRNRDRVMNAAEPKPNELKTAYVHALLLPEPDPQPKSEIPKAPFRLTFSFDSKPVQEWGREYVIDFLTRTEKVELLRMQAKAFIASGK